MLQSFSGLKLVSENLFFRYMQFNSTLCVLCVVPCPISSPVILAYLWVIAVPNVWTLVSKKHLVLNSKDADRQGQFSDGLDCCVCQLSAIFGASWALILVCFAS